MEWQQSAHRRYTKLQLMESHKKMEEPQNLSIVKRTVFWRIQSQYTGDRFGDFPLGDLSQMKIELHFHTLNQVANSNEILGVTEPTGIITMEMADAPEAFAAIAQVAATKLAAKLAEQ